MKQPFEAVWGSVCGSSIEGREGGGKHLTVLLILMLLSDNAWSSVWGIVEKRRRRKTLDATKLDSRERTNRRDVWGWEAFVKLLFTLYVLNETLW